MIRFLTFLGIKYTHTKPAATRPRSADRCLTYSTLRRLGETHENAMTLADLDAEIAMAVR